MSKFILGEKYSREEISKIVGGPIREYMPIVKGAVVCVCLTLEMNRQAPDIVLVGKGPNVEKAAKIFAEQSWAVPLFIRRSSLSWEYMGDFKAKGVEKDPGTIASLGAASGRLDVVSVLYLEK